MNHHHKEYCYLENSKTHHKKTVQKRAGNVIWNLHENYIFDVKNPTFKRRLIAAINFITYSMLNCYNKMFTVARVNNKDVSNIKIIYAF